MRRIDRRREKPDPDNSGRRSGNRFLGLRNSDRNDSLQTIN